MKHRPLFLTLLCAFLLTLGSTAQVVSDEKNNCEWRAQYMRGNWKGTFNQFDLGKYPIIVRVERVVGCDLWGSFIFPSQDGETKFKGEVESSETWHLHENKWIKGEDLVIDGDYYMAFDPDDCEGTRGRYRWPSSFSFTPARLRGQPGGAFTAKQYGGIKKGSLSGEREALAKAALKDWKERGVGETMGAHQDRVTSATIAQKEAEFLEASLNWVAMQRLVCQGASYTYASDKGQMRFTVPDFEPIYLTMPEDEAISLKKYKDQSEIHSIEYVLKDGKFEITAMTLRNPSNDKWYHYPEEPKEPEKEPVDSTVVANEDEGVNYEKREVEVAQEIEVDNLDLILEVYDKTTPDGDVVSIQLNGEWIVKDLMVDKEREQLEITLKPGENILIIHAESEGRIPPNSAGVTLIDGKRKYKYTIQSTLNQSGAIRIVKR